MRAQLDEDEEDNLVDYQGEEELKVQEQEAMVELERMKVTLVRELHEQPSNVLPSMVEGYRVPGGTDGLAATKLGGLEVVLSVADEECNKGGKRAEQSRISSECELWDLP